MYDLILWAKPFSFADAEAATRTRDTVSKKRKQFDQFVQKVNRILDTYENKFPEIRGQILQMQQLIREIRIDKNTVTPDTEGRGFENVMLADVSKSHHNSRTHNTLRNQCKRLFKQLAQKLHPDKGGDPLVFQTVLQAYRNNDLDYLQQLYWLYIKGLKLWWLGTEGLDFWSNQLEKIDVNLKALKGLPQYKVVRFHIAGQDEQAAATMEILMLKYLAAVQAELEFCLARQRETAMPNGSMMFNPNKAT
jgi:hypothetical protein